MKRIYIIDGTSEGLIENQIKCILDNESLFGNNKNGSNRSLNFCGFIFTKDFIIVSLPKTTSLPTDENIEICKLLFKTLLRYFQEGLSITDKSILSEFELNDDFRNLTVFHLYNELIDDWAKFGIFRSRNKVERVGLSGKVNWKKTLQKVVPFYNHKSLPIYPLFHTVKRDLELAGITSEIHRWCVANADSAIGWLKSGGSSDLMFPEIKNYKNNVPCDNATAKYIIKKQLRTQYDQRKIRVLKLILKLIDESSSNQGIGEKVFGVRQFWPIWELMCKKHLFDLSDLHSKALPQPQYLTSTSTIYGHSSKIGQRPDLVIGDREKCLMIIDAKYYDINNSLPGWGDIVKQFFYASSYRTIGYSPEVKNAFLFPLSQGLNDPPKKIEMKFPNDYQIKSLNKEMFRNVFSEIHCEYLDIIIMMKSYVNNIANEELRDSLINGIS